MTQKNDGGPPLDEVFVVQKDVERNPCGAWMAIQHLAAENERLRSVVSQCRGMADQGVDAPNAAYRWCERIEEVCALGQPLEEYEMWAYKASVPLGEQP